MLKTVKIALKDFPTTPSSLVHPATGQVLPHVDVNLADLYHHFYIDTYDEAPPNPDPAHFEHAHHLLPCQDFRFRWNGLGVNKTAKASASNRLGQAFCRWFLSEHLGVHYIAHIDAVRDHGALRQFGGISVATTPSTKGDAPDYFCATRSNDVSLAEAKGTIKAIGFGTKAFQAWRDQFNRVQVKDPSGMLLTVKGVIVATRWAFETDSAGIRTTLSAEDPETPGRRPLGDDGPGLAYAIKALNYTASLRRLRQPLLAAALQAGVRIQPELLFNATVWESPWPPLKGLRFVGGYFPKGPGAVLPYSLEGGKLTYSPPDPFRLDIGSGTFVGIEEQTFRALADTARNGPSRIAELQPIERRSVGYSGLSLLQDGHVIGPIDFFVPAATITL